MIYANKKCRVCGNTFEPKTSRHGSCSVQCSLFLRRITRNSFQKKYHSQHKNDPSYIVKRFLLRTINRMITRKTKKSNEYTSFTQSEFAAEIESKFKTGMSWDNYGKWHIDHKKPLCDFSFIKSDGSPDMQQILEANSLSNLQPLWATENLRKHRN